MAKPKKSAKRRGRPPAATFKPITKADREAILEHIRKTDCPATNVRALILQIEELDRPIREAVLARTRELEERVLELIQDKRILQDKLSGVREPEQSERQMKTVLQRLVDQVAQVFTLENTVGYDGPRNQFEAEIIKIAVDARLALRGMP